jgi:hypothetical protein
MSSQKDVIIEFFKLSMPNFKNMKLKEICKRMDIKEEKSKFLSKLILLMKGIFRYDFCLYQIKTAKETLQAAAENQSQHHSHHASHYASEKKSN